MLARMMAAATLAAAVMLGAEASAQTLVFAGPGGSWQRLMDTQVISRFRTMCNCTVRYLPSTSNESLARVIATKGNPEIDVMYSGDLQQVEGAMLDLFEDLDTTKVPNTANIYPELRAPTARNAYLGIIGAGLIYNTRIFAERGIAPPTSVMDLLRPEFRGRVVIEGADSNYGMGMLILLARAGGGGVENINPGFELARRMRENVVVFARNTTDTTRAFQQGTAWIGWWGDTRAYTMADTGFPIGYVTAREGIPPIIMGASVVRGSRVTATAYQLVNFLLSAEVQSKMAEILSLGPTVRNVTVDQATAARVIHGADAVRRVMVIDWTKVAPVKDAWIERWNREVQR
ncbi:MAG: extracellular solute-binding protein [Alphaproteobacteria bacterium]|nr:extracellular solute-binding protein [Alphaproteobacteria bacterium]